MGWTWCEKIRDADDLSRLIFITTENQMLPLTYTYKLETLNFIVKDKPEVVDEQIRDSLRTVMERTVLNADQKKKFVAKNGSRTKSIDVDQIFYFQALEGHKLALVGQDLYFEFYDSLADILEREPSFTRTHRSYVANLANALSINRKIMEIHFPEELSLPVSRGDLSAVQVVM